MKVKNEIDKSYDCYLSSMKKDEKLFIFLKNNTTNNFKKYSNIFEGEYYNYYYRNANTNNFKFIINFIYPISVNNICSNT